MEVFKLVEPKQFTPVSICIKLTEPQEVQYLDRMCAMSSAIHDVVLHQNQGINQNQLSIFLRTLFEGIQTHLK